MLTLSLFGPFHAVYGTHRLHFATDRARALLTYLALGHENLRREALAALLWPDADGATALLNLRVTLHRLRAALDAATAGLSGQLLQADRKTLWLDRSQLSIDVLLFQADLAAVRGHSHARLGQCERCVALLTRAGALYRGEFLAGFALNAAAAFDEWLSVQREALQQQAVRLFYQLGELFHARQDLATAIDYARRALAIDPFQEASHRLLLALLLQSDRRVEAYAHYDRMRALWRRELGLTPEAATVALLTNGSAPVA